MKTETHITRCVHKKIILITYTHNHFEFAFCKSLFLMTSLIDVFTLRTVIVLRIRIDYTTLDKINEYGQVSVLQQEVAMGHIKEKYKEKNKYQIYQYLKGTMMYTVYIYTESFCRKSKGHCSTQQVHFIPPVSMYISNWSIKKSATHCY